MIRATKTISPAVSIVVLCRNEKDYIEACLQSILAQEPPPGGFEVIVVDGMSDDGTRDLLSQLEEKEPRLRVTDNPDRVTPCGMNTGIREAQGRYIAIMGAHTEYAPDYIRICVELLEKYPEICCSGGPIISRGKGRFGQAVATAMSHPVGIGNAKHRLPHYEGYAEGACFPVFRRETFDKVGFYDPHLLRNQDDDFNYRVALSGGKIFISPRARCTYYVRETPVQLFWQYFHYGYWRVAVLRKHRLPASIRQLAPVVFFFLVLMMLVVGLYLSSWWRLTAVVLPVVYTLILLKVGADVAMQQGPLIGLMFPFATVIMHLAYATGFVWGVVIGQHPRTTKPPAPNLKEDS